MIVRYVGHVALTGEKRHLKERDHFEDLSVGRTVLEWILKK
jgi:hypothetical protein